MSGFLSIRPSPPLHGAPSVLSPENFGAGNEQSRHDMFFIQQAYDALPPHGILYLKRKYQVTHPLFLSGKRGVQIIGRGERTGFKLANGYQAREDRLINGLADQNHGLRLFNFEIDGSGKTMQIGERDKLVKVRGDGVEFSNLFIHNEVGRGFATIVGNNQSWIYNKFEQIGGLASDSSAIHPGNRHEAACNVLIKGNSFQNQAKTKVTAIDAVGSGIRICNNSIHNVNKGIIISWPTFSASKIYIFDNFIVAHPETRAQLIHFYPNNPFHCEKVSDISIFRNSLRYSRVGIKLLGRNAHCTDLIEDVRIERNSFRLLSSSNRNESILIDGVRNHTISENYSEASGC